MITYTDKVQLAPNPNPDVNQWRAVDANEVKFEVNTHLANTSNPHSVTATQVGLGNVDNTSDANKPVSSATQIALNLKANLASPTFTGAPLAPTAAVLTDTTQIATTAFVRANALKIAASSIYSGQNSHQSDGIQNLGNGSLPFEFLHIGNPGFVPQGTESRNLVPAGIVRIGGNILLVRNIGWDQANLRFTTPLQAADAYGSGLLEMGGEGINMQVSPPADNFYNGNRMVFSFRQSDARGVPGYTTGPVNQAMAPFFMHYATGSYQSGKLRSWIPTTATSPLVHLHTDELKGTAGTFDVGELLKLESNSSTGGSGAYLTFANSNGSLETKSAVSTNKLVGGIGSHVYDGVTQQKTAEITFTSRGTISSGNAGQSIKFATSPTNTSGLLSRMEVMNDGVVKFHCPWRYDLTSITTIPDYSTFLTTPVMTTSTLGQIQQASASTGGLRFFGFSTTSTAATAIPLIFSGVLGATAPTAPAMAFNALKHNGSTSATDIAATEIVLQFRNNATSLAEMLGNGNMGFLQATPTAVVDLGAVTTARASLRVRAGATTTAPISPNAGDIWHQGTNNRLMFRKGSTSCEVMASVQVNSVSPTAPDRTIQLTIDGTTYYIHAKTTND